MTHNIIDLLMVHTTLNLEQCRHRGGRHNGPKKVRVDHVIAILGQEKKKSAKHIDLQAAIIIEGLRIIRKETVNRYPPTAEDFPIVAKASES